MYNGDALLEAIAEALRQARRNFVQPFDLSSVIVMPKDCTIDMTIVVDGVEHEVELKLNYIGERDIHLDTSNNE